MPRTLGWPERRSTGASSAIPLAWKSGSSTQSIRAPSPMTSTSYVRGRPARCQTTWTVATAPRSSSSVSARTSSISLPAGRAAPAGGKVGPGPATRTARARGAGEGNVGAGRRDAHGRARDRLYEVDAMAGALQHLTAAGRLVGEPRPSCGSAEHAHGEQAERAIGEESAHVRHPVDRAPLVADRAHDPGPLDRLDDRSGVVE